MVNCCVSGCSNSSGTKKKDPRTVLSFHSFPSNPALRQKWLTAIGMPNWSPPGHARVCSAHFSADQIYEVKDRVRLHEEAVPVIGLPCEYLTEEPSKTLACRVCLATDVKLHSFENPLLRTSINNIMGLKTSIEGAPEYACWECAGLAARSWRLAERARRAHDALVQIHHTYGRITTDLVKEIDRSALNLTSSLGIDKNPSKIIEYEHEDDDEENTPLIFMKSDEFGVNLDRNKPKKETDYNFHVDLKKEIEETGVNKDYHNNEENTVLFEEHLEYDEDNFDGIETAEDTEISLTDASQTLKRKDMNGGDYNPDGLEILKHYNIVELSPTEQLEDFLSSERARGKHYKLECDACARRFASRRALERHLPAHDPSRGAECGVCRVRLPPHLLRAHVVGVHQRRLACRRCRKVFRTMKMARRHHLEHAGFTFRCGHCEYRTAFEVAFSRHARAHTHHGCDCLRTQRTNETATGEDNLEEEVQTNELKYDSKSIVRTEKESALVSKCKRCSHECVTARELKQHIKEAHGRGPRRGGVGSIGGGMGSVGAGVGNSGDGDASTQSKDRRTKKMWTMPGDVYPTKCDHCPTTVGSRKEHWAHVRRAHRALAGSYRSVIAAVCARCGQGFQNTARLRLHELRHGPPTVPCTLCPKKFYDKFLLGVHMETHSDLRPYRCHTCGRGFKTKSNLDKHYRTHSDVAAYECSLCGKKFKYSTSMNLHIRTVHHKIPLPPRKRRSKKNANVALASELIVPN